MKVPVLASSFSFHNCLEEDVLDAFPSIWSWIKSTYLQLQDLSQHANFLLGVFRELKCLFENFLKTLFSPNNCNNFVSFLKLPGRRHRQESFYIQRRFFYKPFTTSIYFYGTLVVFFSSSDGICEQFSSLFLLLCVYKLPKRVEFICPTLLDKLA